MRAALVDVSDVRGSASEESRCFHWGGGVWQAVVFAGVRLTPSGPV